MSIFRFEADQALGEVARVETARVRGARYVSGAIARSSRWTASRGQRQGCERVGHRHD